MIERKYNYVMVLKGLRQQKTNIDNIITDILINRYEHEFLTLDDVIDDLSFDVDAIKNYYNHLLNWVSDIRALTCIFCDKDVVYVKDRIKIGLKEMRMVCEDHLAKLE